MKIAVILYKTNTLANGEHPLMVRVTQKKVRKYVLLGLSCPASLWDFGRNQPRKNHPDKKLIEGIIAKKLAQYHTRHLEMVSEGKPLSPEALIKAVENTKTNTQFFPFLDELINRLVQGGKIGNANVYKDTRRTLKNFATSSTILLTEIDQRFLSKYEAYLRGLGLANTSLSVYFRTLRAVLNKAVKEKLLKADYYPFKDFNVSKFNTTTQKRAITKEDVRKLIKLSIAPDHPLYISQQYFLFSYYGQGMNFRDMAFLKWSDIRGDRVFYQRAKTGKLMQFKLLAPAQAILDQYRPQAPYNEDDYVFPILDKHVHITPTQIDNRSDKVLKAVNKGLKELAGRVGITINLTMYVARHTYATVLKWSGVAIPTISQAMGHANTDITQVYLKSFADEVIDAANEHLL